MTALPRVVILKQKEQARKAHSSALKDTEGCRRHRRTMKAMKGIKGNEGIEYAEALSFPFLPFSTPVLTHWL